MGRPVSIDVVGRIADKMIKFCEVCNSCWEYGFYEGVKSKKVINHYKDFPTYGKKRETCLPCKSATVNIKNDVNETGWLKEHGGCCHAG